MTQRITIHCNQEVSYNPSLALRLGGFLSTRYYALFGVATN